MNRLETITSRLSERGRTVAIHTTFFLLLLVAKPQALVAEPSWAPSDRHGHSTHIIRFEGNPLATYGGGIAGLPEAPRRAGTRRLDARSPEAIAYLDFLGQQQRGQLDRIAAAIGRDAVVEHRYLYVLNGVALRIDAAEAGVIAGLDGVVDVQRDVIHTPDTDVGPGLIGAPAFWTGQTSNGVGNRGEGIVIGIIDSGFNHAHPSFAALASDGYVHVNPVPGGAYLGVCAPAHPNHQALCNDKLIGAYSFNTLTTDPRDEDGHGTHVASTAGGNPVTAGILGLTFPISGVAPRANLINYRVCAPGCPTSASVASVNQAIADGVDVLNYSISGSDNPWVNSVDIAFRDAHAAGLLVTTSAGNTGPGASTTGKTGPWNASVGNSTHARVIGYSVSSAGLSNLLAIISSGPPFASTLSANVADVASEFPANASGCNAFAASALAGRIALIPRGGCTFAIKVDAAAAAGAVAVLVFNNAGGPPTAMGSLEATTIPSAMLDIVDGTAIRTALAGGALPATTVFSTVASQSRPNWQDVLASGSSRGPSQFDVLKPDYVAPGTNILAADLA